MSQQPKRPRGQQPDSAPEPAKAKRARRKGLGPVATMLLSLFMLCIIAGCIVVCVLTVYILQYMGTDTDMTLDSIHLNFTTILYAQDYESGEYYELQRIHGKENRIWVDYDDIPQCLIDATIAGEDERFLSHHGVDWKRTVAAAAGMFLPFLPSSGQGGSTITQQLIKNATGDDDIRVDRKVREIFRALNLEKTATKSQILEAYLNTLGLGNNTNGVQAAANLYFNKDVSELTACESAAIIAITKYPVYYDPFKNPDNNKERRDWILWNMHELGMLTDEEYAEADEQSENLVFASSTTKEMLNADYSWFVDNVIEEVLQDLMTEKNYTYAYASELFFRGGYRVYTTMNEDMQNYLQAKYEDPETFPAIYNEEYPQSAFVITDLNGKVLALVGSTGEKTLNRDFNRATMAQRQAGSTIKPISSYPVALENDLITWSTVFEDKPVLKRNPEDEEPTYPVNHYGHYLDYPLTVDEALRRSTNTVPVQIVEMVGPQMVFDFLYNKLGMEKSLVKEPVNGKSDITVASMALGALTDGVTPLEMAGAYQYIGNGGYFTRPYSYTRVEDSEGNVVLEKDTTAVKVVKPETATIMNRLLQRTTTAQYGTGTSAPFRQDIPVAGKTGTTNDDVDQWFIGMTPYYLGACWLGYDDPQTIRYSNYPPPIIWKNIMSGLHQDLPGADFEYSSNVVAKTYCLESGLLATSECERTATGWYSMRNIPEQCGICDGSVVISSDLDDEDEDEDEDD